MIDRLTYPVSPIPQLIRVSALVNGETPEFIAEFLNEDSTLLITDEESYAAIQQTYVKNGSILKLKVALYFHGGENIDYFEYYRLWPVIS